jgi:hypothetical protein
MHLAHVTGREQNKCMVFGYLTSQYALDGQHGKCSPSIMFTAYKRPQGPPFHQASNTTVLSVVGFVMPI